VKRAFFKEKERKEKGERRGFGFTKERSIKIQGKNWGTKA
jgi:hypothetical protein